MLSRRPLLSDRLLAPSLAYAQGTQGFPSRNPGCNGAVRAGRGFGVTAWIGHARPRRNGRRIVEQIAGHIEDAQSWVYRRA